MASCRTYLGAGRLLICTSIIAIHGLGGSAFKTWTDKDEHLWLRDSLPAHVPTARIMTYGYASTVVFGSSRMTIDDFSLDLLSRLGLMRQELAEKSGRSYSSAIVSAASFSSKPSYPQSSKAITIVTYSRAYTEWFSWELLIADHDLQVTLASYPRSSIPQP